MVEQNAQVQQMFNDGVIKQDLNGQYVPVMDPAESEYIQSQISMSKRKATMTASEAEQINANIENLNEREANLDMQ